MEARERDFRVMILTKFLYEVYLHIQRLIFYGGGRDVIKPRQNGTGSHRLLLCIHQQHRSGNCMPGAADHFEFLVGFCVRSFSREKSQVKRTVPIT